MADEKFGGDVVGVFVLTVLLILVAIGVDDGTFAWLITPIVLVGILYMMFRVPLRHSLMALMFLAFTLENPNDMPAAGHWRSPLYVLGSLMLTHLNNTTGVRALSFSGMDLMFGFLLIVVLYRRSSKSKIDRAGNITTPKQLVRLAWVSLGGTAYVWFSGLIRGGDFSFSLWQIDKVMYLPVVFLFFHVALRGPKDSVALAKVILAAAALRSCIAIYVVQTVVLPPDENGSTAPPWATSHHDSVLFASASVLLASLVLHRAGRRSVWLAALLLPLIIVGMIDNNRRMVWVQIGLVFLTIYLSTPSNPGKRKLGRILLLLTPVWATYVGIGWNAGKVPIFKPVQMIRSVVEPGTDASSITREIENYDIIYTIRMSPIQGTGYGFGYWQIIPLPPMGYDLEIYCPHNSILGLWAFAGYFGYTAMTLLWVAGVYFGMRAYHAAKKPFDKTAALMCFGAVLIYVIQCFGDVGLGSWTGVFMVAPALAMSGKLAVALGAWVVPKNAQKLAAAGPSIAGAPDVAAGWSSPRRVVVTREPP